MIFAMVISKLLGMLRGVLLANAYGITEKATAFSAASRIPLSFFDIVFASAILGCFIPVYNSFTDENKKNGQSEFASVFLNFVLLLTGIVALLGIVFARPLINVVAPGLLDETRELAVLLLRIMFPLIIFAAASYTFVGVLQSNGEYIIPAFISAVSNLFIIVYFLFLNDTFDIVGLAVAYSVAWLIQLLTLVIPLIKTGYRYRPLFNFKLEAFLTALKLTPSIMMGSWLSPICMLISMRFATFTNSEGAVASFDYAVNLYTVITGITTYGVCNYIFPKLSAKASCDTEGFSRTGGLGLLASLLMTVPISAIVLALAPEGVSAVYMRGSFDSTAAEGVTLILRALVPGMLGFTLFEYLSRTFYAIKKPKFVVASVFIGILTNLLALFVFSKNSVFGIGELGVAYSLGVLATGIALVVFSALQIKGMIDSAYFINLIKILLSGAVSAVAMLGAKRLLRMNAFESTFFENVLFAIFVAIMGIIIYVIFLLLLREKTAVSVARKLILRKE